MGEIVGAALLVVVVLGGLIAGPWLLAALIARRRDQPDLSIVFTRRASTSTIAVGALAVVLPLGNVLLGTPWSSGAAGLTAAGLLLVAGGLALRRAV